MSKSIIFDLQKSSIRFIIAFIRHILNTTILIGVLCATWLCTNSEEYRLHLMAWNGVIFNCILWWAERNFADDPEVLGRQLTEPSHLCMII